MPSTQRKGRFLLGTSLVGLVVFFALSGMTQLVAPFRVLLFSPFVQVLVVLAAVGMGTVFLLWGRLPGGGDRRAYVAAVLVMGLLLVLFQGVAPALGWLGGPVTAAPLLMQGLIYGMSLAALVALLLAGYRWLARRRVFLALTTYALLSLAMILATIFGDRYALSSGLMTFGNGYTVFVDIGYGLSLLWVPLAIYALLCLRFRVTSAPSLGMRENR
jgi:hypothetical protein